MSAGRAPRSATARCPMRSHVRCSCAFGTISKCGTPRVVADNREHAALPGTGRRNQIGTSKVDTGQILRPARHRA